MPVVVSPPKPAKEPFGESFVRVSKGKLYARDERAKRDAIDILARYQDDDELRSAVQAVIQHASVLRLWLLVETADPYSAEASRALNRYDDSVA